MKTINHYEICIREARQRAEQALQAESNLDFEYYTGLMIEWLAKAREIKS